MDFENQYGEITLAKKGVDVALESELQYKM